MKGKIEFEISRIRAATRSQQLYCTVFESVVKTLVPLSVNVDLIPLNNLIPSVINVLKSYSD